MLSLSHSASVGRKGDETTHGLKFPIMDGGDKASGDGDAGSIGTLSLVGLGVLGCCVVVIWGLICTLAPCSKALMKCLLRQIAPDWYDDRFGVQGACTDLAPVH